MADLNALIAQGYQFQPLPDPFAQYGKMQQLQNAGIQNQLTQQQLAAAQRAEMQTNALNQAYSSAINPETGEIDYGKLRSAVASSGAGSQIPGIEKERLAAEKAVLETKKLQGEITAQPVALAGAKSKVIDEQLKRSKELLDRINPNDPNVRDQLMAWHQGNHTGYLGELLKSQGSTPEKTMADIDAAVAGGPKGISDFIGRSVEGTQAFQKKIAPMPKEVSNGKEKFLRDENPLSPTYMQEIPGSRTTLQMSPYETDHLQFLKDKEKFDQENPGFELREQTQTDGSTKTVKVNKKTGLASDVVYEGPEGKPVTGVSIPFKDLAFRQQEAAFKQANPMLSIQKIGQSDGSEIVVAVNPLNATYQPVVAQGGTFVPSGPAIPLPSGMPSAAAPAIAPESGVAPAVVPNALVGGAVNNAFVSSPTGVGQPLISAAKKAPETKSDFEKTLDSLNLTEDEKKVWRLARLKHDTNISTQAGERKSQLEQTMDDLNLSDKEKNAYRKRYLDKQTKSGGEGGGGEKFPTGSVTVIDPTDPAGKRAIVVTAKRAITEGLTPFTSIPKEGGPTEGERKAATLLQRLQFSESQLLTALGEDPNAAKPGLLASAVAKVSDPVANFITPAARQKVEAAQLDILDAALTLGTGAAYTNEQLKGYAKSYFPQVGDKPENIKDKQKRLENVIQAAKIAAGRAEKSVSTAPNAGGSAINAADAILNKGRR